MKHCSEKKKKTIKFCGAKTGQISDQGGGREASRDQEAEGSTRHLQEAECGRSCPQIMDRVRKRARRHWRILMGARWPLSSLQLQAYQGQGQTISVSYPRLYNNSEK